MKIKKVVLIVVGFVIAVALVPIIVTSVNTASVENNTIEYDITSTSTVISSTLTSDQIDYIITNYDYISDHTDITLASAVIESYVNKDNANTPLDIDLNFTTAILTYTASTDLITSTVNLAEGTQSVVLYFVDIPIVSTTVTILALLPLIFVAGILMYFYKRNKLSD